MAGPIARLAAGPLTRHAEAASTARAATESSNLASFSAAFSEAKAEAAVIGPALANARVLLGGLTDHHQRFQSDSRELAESASKLRSRVVLHVAPTERASEDGAKAVRQSLARLGFSAESGRRPSCPEQEPGFSLAVQLELGCEDRPNTVGQYPCRPRLDLRVRDCSEQSLVLVAEVSGKAIWGAGNSPDRARRQALERLNSNRLDPLLSETLSSALPTP